MSVTVSPVMEKFIDSWGEMGTRWGVNRTVAQVHALFYLSPEPLNAEEIAAALGVARSNASTSLRELESWGLVKPVRVRGDRRQHFEAIKDVWEMFRIILDERKRREVDPTVAALRVCLQQAQEAGAAEPYTKQRLKEALDFFDVMTPLYDELRRLPGGPVRSLAKLTSKVRTLMREPGAS
jgi:DNA-binding transcriptional regulator GbsR (MarR family)